MPEKFFSFAADGNITVFGRKFIPEKQRADRGIVLISHGISEHSGRYARFAEALNDKGYVVYAPDQRGHGKTADVRESVHVDEGGFEGTVDDLDRLFEIALSENPGQPVYIFGHSLGSVFARKYIQKYRRKELKGVVLSGPVAIPDIMTPLKKRLSPVIARFGRKHIDIETIIAVFGPFNERFQPEETPYDWVTSDRAERDRYVSDPFCGQPQSAGYLYDMADTFDVYDESAVGRIDKNLPILMVTGDQDPVTGYAKGAVMTKNIYDQAGMRHVDLIIYPEARHELLNEVNRKKVTKDIIHWLGMVSG